MSPALHLVSKCIPAHGPSDGKSLPRSGVSGSSVFVSPCTSNGRYEHTPMVKVLSLRCSSRNIPICCASSGSSHRRNSDFSRQNKHGFSRGRNRQSEERDNLENFEDSDMFSSKNGPLLSSSGSSKFQATVIPGPKEKEIVELFKKVQAQLRERQVVKEERKIEESQRNTEESQRKVKESETVDSLLKLLKKHSVQQEKINFDTDINKGFVLDQPDRRGLFSEERNTDIFDSSGSVKNVKQDNEAPVTSRPRSNFQRRSPVSRVKVEPVYADYDEQPDESASLTEFDGRRTNLTLEPELEVESDNEATFSDGDIFDHVSDDETSDVYEDDNTNIPLQNAGETSNLSEMKITELKALAKSQGLKRFSKLKKHELIELLSGGSI